MVPRQVRGTGGVDSASTGGTWDVSKADRIGKGEVDLQGKGFHYPSKTLR